MSESASNDGVTAGDDSAAPVVAGKRQQTSSDVTDDADHLVPQQVPPSTAAAASAGRRHGYHQPQIGGYDARCFASNTTAASAAVGYLPGAALSCVPPYFTTCTGRADVFQSNHSLDATEGLYPMQRA